MVLCDDTSTELPTTGMQILATIRVCRLASAKGYLSRAGFACS
jgi:hypothetical protein